ncbi:hypothetical protein K466DRAFT_668082 [Polyporus arcularius HHB13444]|uniref:BTB domain-containing protein n=1 Tax=Polyporus arcularius HHB13444 TaxID=1314778 RepID=A0A5C3NQL6_9APHY|nr:hypothetical protein K466DRAFT_668082 [Polyporus arcularius HHB13444]
MPSRARPESPLESFSCTSERHSASGQVARKTAKTDRPRPDAHVWYADGDIVIIAQETVFRVHKSVVARHSKALECMFQPISWGGQADLTNTFDGLPTVRVTDTAYDFKHFLLVVYDGFPRDKDPHTVVDFGVFAAWLRIGHRYRVPSFVIEGLRGFRSIFPMDLDTWDKHRFDGKFLHPRVVFDNTNAIEAVNAIRLAGKVHLLPGALYMCAQLRPSTLLAGTTRADGTPEKLGAADLLLCFEMKERLRKAEARIAVQWAAQDHVESRCKNFGDHCDRTRHELLKEACRNIHNNLRGDPLHGGVITRLHEVDDGWQLCSHCHDAMTWEVRGLRRALWNKLPVYAGVEADIRNWGKSTQGY